MPRRPTARERQALKARKASRSFANGLGAQLKIPKTPLVLAFQHLDPNWRAYLYYVDQAAQDGDADMQKLVDTFKKMTRYEQDHYLSPEWLCEHAGVAPRTLLKAIVPFLYDHGHFEHTIVQSIYRPKVYIHTAKQALRSGADGFKDRELFLKTTGDVPIPRHQTTNIQAVGGTHSLIGKRSPIAALPSPGEEIMELELADTLDADGS